MVYKQRETKSKKAVSANGAIIKSAVSALAILIIFYSVHLWYNYSYIPQLRDDITPDYLKYINLNVKNNWACVKDSERADYMMRLMSELSPKDREIFDKSRSYKLKLEKKKKAGTLTVKENSVLNSGYYSGDDMGLYFQNPLENPYFVFNRSNSNFRKPLPFPPKQASIYDIMLDGYAESSSIPFATIMDGIGEITLVYQDEYSRWEFPLIRNKMFRKIDEMTDDELLEDWQSRLFLEYRLIDKLKSKAKEVVENMPANEVAENNIKYLEQKVFDNLFCDERK